MSKDIDFELNGAWHRRVGVNVLDSPLNDAFGRLRVSEPYSIFSSKLITNKQLLFYDEVVNGTATSVHDTNEASVTMTVSANNDYAIRQTFMRFNYQPGKSQFVKLTGILGEPIANTNAKIGYFNTSFDSPYTTEIDGLYFGHDGTDVYVAKALFGTETKVTQANWNIDKMDGTGPSGLAAHWDSVQIFMIDFEWLGVGRVRMGLNINGMTYYVHEFNHANIDGQDTVYMATPNHSVRYEVRSTGGTTTLKQICASIESEGGVEPSGITRSVSNGITPVSCTTTVEGVLFIRLSLTNPCGTIIPQLLSALATSNNAANYEVSLILNPTIAGTALTWNALTNSSIEYAVGTGNNTLTNGTVLYESYTSGDLPAQNVATNLVINPGISINGTQDVIAVAIRTLSGTESFVSSLNIRELTCG